MHPQGDGRLEDVKPSDSLKHDISHFIREIIAKCILASQGDPLELLNATVNTGDHR